MSKLIEDAQVCSSVIFADNRNSRPYIVPDDHTSVCPFCLENENLLQKVWLQKKVSEDEQVRIVNNKYPICDTEGELYGIHDVIIDTQHHAKSPKDFTNHHWHILLMALQERYHFLREDKRIKFIQIFKNYGVKAGASISHSHWQIVALETVPATKWQEQNGMVNPHNKCKLCGFLESHEEHYLIQENEAWIVIAPRNSIYPYETWIIPKIHYKNYGDIPEKALDELGKMLKKTLMAYERVIPNIHYNICFMNGALNMPYHFFVKIFPRTGNVAGFELATGCYINVVSPDTCKKKMIEAFKSLAIFE